MKVIFCDIDGVLNSEEYDMKRDPTAMSFIDESRLTLIKRIVDATGAKIVLSSSWRSHWDKNIERCDKCGAYITNCFSAQGIEIFDKTGFYGGILSRKDEIKAWLGEHEAEKFAILDDYPFGWGELSPYLIKTSRFGGGLTSEQAEQAIKLLN